MKKTAASIRPSSFARTRTRKMAMMASALVITAAQLIGAAPATHWYGGTNGTWTGANWASDPAGTPTAAIPASTADVTFSAAGAANQNTTLGADFTIRSLTIGDAAPVTIGGANTLTIDGGGVTVNAGAGLFTVNANLTLATSGDFTVNNADGAVVNGVLDGTAGLTKFGTGSLTLANAANTYSGGTTINAGRLVALYDGSLGTGGVTMYGGELLVDGATFATAKRIELGEAATGRLSNSNTGSAAVFSGGLTLGVGANLSIGSAGNTGIVELRGVGDTNAAVFVNVDFGTLRNGDDSGFTQYTSIAQQTTVAEGATLDANGFDSTILNLQGAGTLTNNGGEFGNFFYITRGDFSGSINDGSNQVFLQKNGAADDLLRLTGVSNFTGGTFLNGGTLSFANGSLGTTGPVEFVSTSTLRWEPGNTQDLSARLVLDDGVNAIFDTNGNDVTFANALTLGGGEEGLGDAAITKTGAGKLTMLGTNTYTGGTTLLAGTLSFDNGSLGTVGTIDIAVTSTLQWYSGNTQDISSRLKIEDGVNATLDTNGNDVTLASALQLGPNGTAALTKDGLGTLTILGANTYTGGTTINAGTLFLGDGFTPGAALGTGGVTVNANATFQLNLANNETFPNNVLNSGHVVADDAPLSNYTMSGVISGTGDFTKIGGNTVTLSGLNTYTGNTYVNGGTLLAGTGTPGGPGAAGPGPFGQNSAVYVNPGGILQLNGFNVSIAALLSNPPGGIVQNSSVTPATLTLTGVDNFGFFHGIIQDGILTVQNQQQARQPSRAVQAQTPAPLSLWMAGSGIQILAGLNSYTGTTTVTSGILRAGISNPEGGPGAFGNNSAVTVSGTGILQLGGNDVVIGSLAGDTGGIVENSGRIQVRQPSAFNAQATPATLTIGGNNTDTTFAGTIRDGVNETGRQPAGEKTAAPLTGPLAIVKTGTGTQVLSGNNSYTGGTTLIQGTLAAGSTKAFGSGDLTVTSGALKTTGGPLSVDIGAGNILFTGGTFQAGVGGTVPGVQHDQLVTTGTANINGGTLALVQLNNYHLAAGDRIVLVSAKGGVTDGTANGSPVPPSKVTGLAAFSNTPLLVPAVNRYTTSVILEAMQGSFVISGLTPNQIATAEALNSLAGIAGGHTGVFKELDFLDNQPAGRIPSLLDMIAPEELTLVFQLAKSLANVQTSNIQGRLAEIRAELDQILSINSVNIIIGGSRTIEKQAPPLDDERWGVWMIGSGEFTRVGTTANAAGFDLDSGGVTAGVDYRFTNHFVAGISIGYVNTTASTANGGKVDVNGGRVGAYATYFNRNFYVDASVSGGPNSYNTRRITPNNTTATANPGGTEVNLFLATGYDWKKGALTFGPVASFQYTNVQLDGFTETGGFAPLSVIRKNADSMRSAIGIRASYDIKVGRAIVRPEARVSWQHEFGDTSYSLTSTFATLGGNPFTVAGPETGRESMLVRAGVTVQWNDRFSTQAFYDGELLRKNYSSNNVSLGFRWKF